MAGSLVPILATRELVAPIENSFIISGRSIWLFRHLKHQNQSTGDDFICSCGIILLVSFLATKEAVVPLPPWWAKMELKNYFTTLDKIITSEQILVFEVSKQPS